MVLVSHLALIKMILFTPQEAIGQEKYFQTEKKYSQDKVDEL